MMIIACLLVLFCCLDASFVNCNVSYCFANPHLREVFEARANTEHESGRNPQERIALMENQSACNIGKWRIEAV
jgi:hypothetical protein